MSGTLTDRATATVFAGCTRDDVQLCDAAVGIVQETWTRSSVRINVLFESPLDVAADPKRGPSATLKAGHRICRLQSVRRDRIIEPCTKTGHSTEIQRVTRALQRSGCVSYTPA